MVALPATVVAAEAPAPLPWPKRASVARTELSADTSAITDFLRSTIADAIHLVAIVPEGPPPTGRWFGNDPATAAIWAAERNAEGANVYWTVNRVRDGLNGKPRKADIVAARFAHVDIDPPKNGSAWDKAGALAALAELESVPSFVIDSGGGLQGFWRLEDESLNLDAIEAINTGIRDRFGADPCQNIDRLMRLPATVNWPDARKRARGRGPTLSSVAEDDDGTVHQPYVLAYQFPVAAPKPEATPEPPAVATAVSTLLTADDLGLSAFDPVRMAIEHPPGRDRSRDAQAVAGDMVRAGFSDEQVMGVLLNPANPVSAHCLAQSNAPRAAARCLSRARADQARKAAETAEGAAIAAAFMPAAANDTGEVLELDDIADWHDVEIPAQRWLMDGWLPIGEAALLTGAGAIGKSLLAEQLAICVAAGRPILGVDVEPATVIYITCEDARPELARRAQSIAAGLGVSLGDLRGRVLLKSWKGRADNELVSFDRERAIRPTARFAQLRATALAAGARLIVLDNTSHLFGGDENVKREVTLFCNLLNGLAEEIDGVVLLLGHPNKGGLMGDATRGNQFGGSIAWEAQVRSRMFLAPVADDDDARELTNPKANYSAKGAKLAFRWHRGAFVRPDDLPPGEAQEIARSVLASADDAAFLACLALRNAQHRAVSDKRSPTYAPTVFVKMPEARGTPKERLDAAMERLFAAKRIERAPLWIDSEQGKWVHGLRSKEPTIGQEELPSNGPSNGPLTRSSNTL